MRRSRGRIVAGPAVVGLLGALSACTGTAVHAHATTPPRHPQLGSGHPADEPVPLPHPHVRPVRALHRRPGRHPDRRRQAAPAAAGHCDLDPCFATTPQGRRLAANAWRHGFVLRYPAGQEHVTGIEFEPWHYRYVGVPVATAYHDEHATTLETFFGLPPAPSYR
jgi:hypothetical protein